MPVVNLCGGGLDSAALIYMSMLDPQVPMADALLHIDYRQVAATAELEAVKHLRRAARTIWPGRYREPRLLLSPVQETTIRDLNQNSELFGGSGNPFLRGRNLELVTRAAGVALQLYGAEQPLIIQLGLCVEQMMFDDANGDYIELLNQVMQASYGTTLDGRQRLVSVTAPLAAAGWHKLPLFEHLYRSLSVAIFYRAEGHHRQQHGEFPLELHGQFIDAARAEALRALFEVPFSCWTPVEGKACGTCYHCTKLAQLRQDVIDGA